MKLLTFNCWNKFYDSKNEKFIGKKFEELVNCLLVKHHGPDVWQATQETWDGKKDFYKEYTVEGIKFYDWAECKIYNKSISINILAPTFIMSTLHPINQILIFSYSPLNPNAKKTLADFSSKHNKKVKIYDDEKLEKIIIQLLSLDEMEHFFSDLPPSLSQHSSDIITCHEIIYVSNYEEFYNTYDFQKISVQLYELLILSATIENRTLNTHQITAFMDLDSDLYKYFEGANKKLHYQTKRILAPGEIITIKFPIRIVKYSSDLNLPTIKIYLNNEYFCSLDSKCKVTWLIESPLIGYQSELDKIRNIFLCKTFSIIYVYGKSGVGKTRLCKEINSIYELNHSESILIKSNQNNLCCKIWLKKIFSKLFSLPLIQVENLSYKSSINSDIELVMEIIYNNDFVLSSNIEKLALILIEKLVEKDTLLIIDNVQDFDNDTQLFLNKFLNYADISSGIHLVLAFNNDLLFPDSMSFSLFERLKLLHKDNKKNYLPFEVKDFEKNQALMFINHCLNLSYAEDKVSLNNQFFIEKIISISHNNPLFLEQILIDLYQNNIIIFDNEHFYINDNIVLDQYFDSLPIDINHFFDSRIKYIKNKNNENWGKIKDSIRLICFFRELPKIIFEEIIEDESILSLLINSGIIKIEGDISFYHQIIQKYFNDRNYGMTKLLMKKCVYILKEYILTDTYIAQYNICYLQCYRGNKTFHCKAVDSLLKGNISNDFLEEYTQSLLSSLNRYGYMQSIVPADLIIFFTKYCYGASREKNYNITLQRYRNIYNFYIKPNNFFKKAGYEYSEFLKNYMNTLLTLNLNKEVILHGKLFLESIDQFTFQNDQIQKAKASIYNRMHVAVNRIEPHLDSKPYSKNAFDYLNYALELSKSCNDIRRIIQNEIDYGNMYFCSNIKLCSAVLHWNKAYNEFQKTPEQLLNLEGIVYFHASIMNILNRDYNQARETINRVNNNFLLTLLNPFFYIKANILSVSLFIMQSDWDNAFKQMETAENLCQTFAYKKGYPICTEMRAILNEFINKKTEQALFLYKKAFRQYCEQMQTQAEQENQKEILLNVAAHICNLNGQILEEDLLYLRSATLAAQIDSLSKSLNKENETLEILHKPLQYWCDTLQTNLPLII